MSTKLILQLTRTINEEAKPLVLIGLSKKNEEKLQEGVFLRLDPSIPKVKHLEALQYLKDTMPEEVILVKDLLEEKEI